MRKTSPGRIAVGLILSAVFLCGVVGFGSVPLGHVLLDVAGRDTVGLVTEARDGVFSSRYRKYAPAFRVDYAFTGPRGDRVSGSDYVSDALFRRAQSGHRVTVTYWPMAPWVCRIERKDLGDPLFLAICGLSLACLGLAGAALYRAFVPPPGPLPYGT